MTSVPRPPWPVTAAVVAVVAVVGATIALATPDRGTTAAPTLGPSATVTATPSASPSDDADPTPTPAPTEAAAPATDPAAAPVDPASPVETVADYVELPPVPVDATADYGNGVTARILGIEAVDAVARGPGEVSGPGVVVEVEVTAGADDVVLDDVVVNLYSPSGDTAPAVTGDRHYRPFAGTLPAGRSATASYVLRPAQPDAPARITVSYSGAVPAATFEGALP